MNNNKFLNNNYSCRKFEKFINELKENKYKRISFLVGAGISTSAGIPDFRSENGIYSVIKEKYNLEKPTDLFDIKYFWKNPQVYYTYLQTEIRHSHNPTKSHVKIFI